MVIYCFLIVVVNLITDLTYGIIDPRVKQCMSDALRPKLRWTATVSAGVSAALRFVTRSPPLDRRGSVPDRRGSRSAGAMARAIRPERSEHHRPACSRPTATYPARHRHVRPRRAVAHPVGRAHLADGGGDLDRRGHLRWAARSAWSAAISAAAWTCSSCRRWTCCCRFPSLILGLIVVALLGPDLINLVFAIALTAIAPFARIARAPVLSLKERAFVEAGRALGFCHARILFVHILPNILSEVLVMGSLWMATAVRTEASLSLHRPGREAADRHLGRHDARRVREHPRRAVAVRLPGPRDPDARARPQHGRRRAARRDRPEAARRDVSHPTLEVVGLKKHFIVTQGLPAPRHHHRPRGRRHRVSASSQGEAFGLVGESGCGKSHRGPRAPAADRAGRRRHPLRRCRRARRQRVRTERAAPAHADRLPGPVFVAQPARSIGRTLAEPLARPRHRARQGSARDGRCAAGGGRPAGQPRSTATRTNSPAASASASASPARWRCSPN